MLGLIVTLLASSFVVSSSAQCLTGNDSPTAMNPNTKTIMTEARMSFAMDALKEAARIEGSQSNLFFSPHSLHQAITLAYFGARGHTETLLKKALHIPENLSKVDVQRSYGIEKSLQQIFQQNASAKHEYTSANRIWISSNRRVRPCMLGVFNNELETADFTKEPDVVRVKINDWVSSTTKGQIKDLLASGTIDESTDLVLANAVYFKGLWQNPFNKIDSKSGIFFGVNNSIVTYMCQKKNFNHAVSEELGAHVLELPYEGDSVSMFVFLPPYATSRSNENSVTSNSNDKTSDRDGIRQLIEKITSTEKGRQEFRDILEYGMQSRVVNVTFPRFTVDKQLEIRPLLEALHADEIFSAGADFRGFADDGDQGLHLGDAVHRAKVDVNEEGTVAAAATAIFSFRSSRPAEPADFNANHPFLYFIYDLSSKSILFTGIYRSPTTNVAA